MLHVTSRRVAVWGTIAILVLSSLTASVVASTAAASLPAGVPDGAVAAKVVDYLNGDHLQVKVSGKSTRLDMIGIEAPRLGTNDIFKPYECYAQQALDHIKKLVKKGGTVYLESDHDDHDDSGQLLRYVWVSAANGKPAFMLNLNLVQGGYVAFRDDDPNSKHNDVLKAAEDQAKAKKAGLWGKCSSPHQKLKPLGVSDNPAPVGMAIAADDEEVTLVGVSFVDAMSFYTPQPGNMLMVLNLSIKDQNKTDNRDYNEFCVSARDTDRGYSFRVGLNPSDTPFGSGEVHPGETATGQVVLEVKADSQHIRVDWGSPCVSDDLYWMVVPGS